MGTRSTRGAIAVIGAAIMVAGVLGGTAPASVAASADAPPPVVFIVDASGSMARKTPSGPSRMDVAKSAVKSSIAALPSGSQVGLLVFGTGTGNTDAERTAGCSDVKTLAPLAPLDAAALSSQVDSITESGFTPISTALRQAFGMLPADKTGNVVLISDGVDTCSPPSSCQVASELHAQSPQVAINVVAFGVDDDEEAQQQMTCISGVGGGVASSATDTTQLAARLRAATSDRSALNAAGMNGIRLGMTLAEVRHLIDGATVSAPTTADGVEVVYVDCSWGRIELHDGRVYAISPTETSVATADGIAPGTALSDVEALYGKPVETGSDSYVYQLTRGSTDGYRVYVDSSTRTVKRVILCRCAPMSAVSATAADWEITFDGVGPLRLGTTPDAMSVAVPSLRSRSGGQVLLLNDSGGGEWLTANVENGTLVSISVSDPRATATTVTGLGYPSASGIRLGESMSTVLTAYPGGMFYRNAAGGMSDYVVTDREGHVLTFSAIGTAGGLDDLAGSIRAGRLRAVKVEDAAVTRAPAQTAATSPSSAEASIPGLPSFLAGTWCPPSGKDCLSFSDLASTYPNARFDGGDGSPSASTVTTYGICLAPDPDYSGCISASSMSIEYYPVGVGWNCTTEGARSFGLPSCNPDYTSAHDTSRVRIVVRPNHQQDSVYHDVEPKYRVG